MSFFSKPMSKTFSNLVRISGFFASCFLLVFLLLPVQSVYAKRPPEIRNQEELNISKDMHGKDLGEYEFVKLDLRGIDFSDSDLKGAVFNNSKLNNTNFHGADLKDALAYASDFENADLSDVDFNNALLMESTFDGANIDGADFTDAVISRIQQKQLCSIASGENSKTGESTSYSLGC